MEMELPGRLSVSQPYPFFSTNCITSVSSIPLSQFNPANFTGLPDSHQPAAWLAPVAASSPKDSVVVSRAFVIFIVTLPNKNMDCSS